MDRLGGLIMAKLNEKEPITSDDIFAVLDAEECSLEALHGTLLSLSSKEKVNFGIEEIHERNLTDEGKETLQAGSTEFRLYNMIGEEGADASLLDQYPHGAKHAFKNKWIKIQDGQIYKTTNNAADSVVEMLKNLSGLSEKQFGDMKRRNLANTSKKKVYKIRKGPKYDENAEVLPELTAAILADYSGQPFKKYNFDSLGNIPLSGSFHPLMKMRQEIKRIFVEMGFEEMNTSKYVESSFWNFDSLFQPQNHPARDSHDTFFLSKPARTKPGDDNDNFDTEYFERVGETHLGGGYGSIGHGGTWSSDEALKNVLRTHTTAASSRYLKKLAKDFKPIKLFSIDKVFRNESVDATHLAEFHQVEGLIAGYSLGISDLMGVLKSFFGKLGLTNIKFKPAFNPYTEPSMEVFGFHPGLQKWIEIGNSGIFRPEMLGPMGYDHDVCVIAWGLSLERPAMIKYGLNNIRELVGHKVDLDFIRRSAFVHFE